MRERASPVLSPFLVTRLVSEFLPFYFTRLSYLGFQFLFLSSLLFVRARPLVIGLDIWTMRVQVYRYMQASCSNDRERKGSKEDSNWHFLHFGWQRTQPELDRASQQAPDLDLSFIVRPSEGTDDGCQPVAFLNLEWIDRSALRD